MLYYTDMKRLHISEALALLEPCLTKVIASSGYSSVGLKSEPITYTQPIGEGLYNVARFQINGWDTPELYLTVVIGVNEPNVARQFIKAAYLGGVSYRTLELCGGPIWSIQDPQGNSELWSRPVTQASDFEAIASEAVKVAVERTHTELSNCQTMPGLYEALKNYQNYSKIRQFDDKQMMFLIPIVEYSMGKIEVAKRTIAENIRTLEQARWKKDHELEDYISKLKYITEP